LNLQRYSGAEILLTRDNFGCGSSREHALWALAEFGIRAIVAPSFADIFHGNCFKNGVLPISLPATTVSRLFAEVDTTLGYRLEIDLPRQAVITPDGTKHHFEIDLLRKETLIHGHDEIDATLRHAKAIDQYERQRSIDEPWLFQ